jgi:hypothetical protein
LLAEGANCLIYAECGLKNVDEAACKKIAKKYDDDIHNKMIEAFGSIEYMPGNRNKVIFLILDIKDGYNSAVGGSYIGGYFNPLDMYDKSNSNKLAMLYLDAYPQTVGGDSFYSTMAHEEQHLINFSNIMYSGGVSIDTWVNEGLSTAAEYIYGGDPSGRIRFYNDDDFGTIAYGNNFFVWNGFWERSGNDFPAGTRYDPVADYATAYLFFQWLRIHSSKGSKIYKDIVDNAIRLKKGDYNAVTEAAANSIDSSFSDWGKLLETWLVANYIYADTGYYGYKRELAAPLKAHTFPTGSLKLSPGESVYSKIQSVYAPPSSGENIQYRSISSSGYDDNFTGGRTLLTYNGNVSNGGGGELGYTASQLVQPNQFNIAASEVEKKIQHSYPIDVMFDPNGIIRDE